MVGLAEGDALTGNPWSQVTRVEADPPAYVNVIVARPARRIAGIETVAELSAAVVA
jgi:hypothetical protein